MEYIAFIASIFIFPALIALIVIAWIGSKLIAKGLFSWRLLCLIGFIVGFLSHFIFKLFLLSRTTNLTMGTTTVVQNNFITIDGYFMTGLHSLAYGIVGFILSCLIWLVMRKKIEITN